MKVLLPIGDHPPLRAHQFYALPLSIIELKSEQYLAWFMNEFTQIYAFEAIPNQLSVKFYSDRDDGLFEPLESVQIPLRHLELTDSYVEFYRLFLKKGYYIRTFCDCARIRALEFSHTFWHDLMLFGFDDSKREFWIKAYVQGELTNLPVSYEELEFACAGGDQVSSENEFVTLYRLKDLEIRPRLEKLKWHLLDYIEKNNTAWRECAGQRTYTGVSWGLAVYDKILELASRPVNQKLFETNNLYCLYEHKQHLRAKLRYFAQQNLLQYPEEIDGQLQQVEQMTDAMLRRTMKINQMLERGLNIREELKHFVDITQKAAQKEENSLMHLMDCNPVLFYE